MVIGGPGALGTTLCALAAAPFAGRAFAQGSAPLADHVEFRRPIAANRILAREEVVDAFGHVSVRDPENPKRYVMARSRSPELVEQADLIRFEQDGRSLDPTNRTPYGGRMIHGAIYEARSEVHSVVHNHAYSVLPFSITGARVR
jgi:ribulose-5-phosphate 4-epimerase/fuculose-1-phosphate aldolase